MSYKTPNSMKPTGSIKLLNHENNMYVNNKISEIVSSINVNNSKPTEYLENIFGHFVSNQINLINNIIKTKNLYDMTIIDLEKTNVISIFDELQEVFLEIYKLLKIVDETTNCSYTIIEIFIEILFEIIDIVHFWIQHYILSELRRKNKQIIDTVNTEKLFKDSIVNLIVNSFIEGFQNRVKEKDFSIDVLCNDEKFLFVKHGIINLKQYTKLSIYSEQTCSFNDLYIRLNFQLSKILQYIPWKFWKTYNSDFDVKIFEELGKFFVDIYYLFMKVVSLYAISTSQINIIQNKDIIEFDKIFRKSFEESMLESMLLIYLYKNLENNHRQAQGY